MANYKIPLNEDGTVDIEDIVNDCAYGCNDHSDYRGILQALVDHTRRETYLDAAKVADKMDHWIVIRDALEAKAKENEEQ